MISDVCHWHGAGGEEGSCRICHLHGGSLGLLEYWTGLRLLGLLLLSSQGQHGASSICTGRSVPGVGRLEETLPVHLQCGGRCLGGTTGFWRCLISAQLPASAQKGLPGERCAWSESFQDRSYAQFVLVPTWTPRLACDRCSMGAGWQEAKAIVRLSVSSQVPAFLLKDFPGPVLGAGCGAIVWGSEGSDKLLIYDHF